MHCDQCGKENRSGSKFCKFCGASLTESSGSGKRVSVQKFSWKNPIVILLIALIVLGGLGFGGYKAYAYYQVQSKITSAKKLQGTGDFNGSLSAVSDLGGNIPSAGQQSAIASIKADDQKFLTYKASFDAAVALENASSTASTSTSDNLQAAMKDLQSIDSSYPVYKNVQAEMTKVQNSLVTALQSDADTSKKAAAAAQAQAASAAAAKAKAEANAQKAQSQAAAAQQTASDQQAYQVELSFVNQLQSAYTDFHDNAEANYSSGISYSNDGENSTALILFAKANAAAASTQQAVKNMNNNYTNLPDTYQEASSALGLAAYYLTEATNAAIDNMTSSYDESSTINGYKNQAIQYANEVSAFLANP